MEEDVLKKKRTKWNDAVNDLNHSGLLSCVKRPNLSQLGKIENIRLKDLVDQVFHDGYQPRRMTFLNKDRFFVAQDFSTGINLYSVPKETKVSYSYRMQHQDGRTYPIPYVGYKYDLLLLYKSSLDGNISPSSLGITEDFFRAMLDTAKEVCDKHSNLYRIVNPIKEEELQDYNDTEYNMQVKPNIRKNRP
ncbi:hypothetical protein IG611_09665 [Pectobacterium sp. A535-S3-A17]|uniref:hypothetical protein n=1 Tax=Pectobacterium quasiaquaticum TaxID=2774015 RepID=UPI001873E5DF|nr:hypothetical protein [Pectobacterium quasiaquaticum]MBE5212571.1 hypothetical protein [Pectobacterium quasiaquaticum]MBE5225623.1 hypothetical protein [Pectobacterium quasiaquaticum]